MAIHPSWNQGVEELISGSAVQERVTELAAKLQETHGDLEPLVIVVLNGAVVFAADLVRHCTFPLEMDFVRVKSYVGQQSSGHIKLLLENQISAKGRHVLIIEDIVETGNTIEFLKSKLMEQEPLSVNVVCLLHKPNPQNEHLVDVSGFRIGKEFVVGYGLDYCEKHRNLPYIGRLTIN
jgi:hypoxanthine phosphoribosyltransferase